MWTLGIGSVLSAIWLVGWVLQPGATGAYLSDTATSSNNTFRSAASFNVPPPACQGSEWKSAEIVILTDGADTYEAGNGKEIIFGLGGDDHITGDNGMDCILGGPGDDTLIGGNGPDYIDGGDGNDTCSAGHGPAVIVNCENSGPPPPPQCEDDQDADDDCDEDEHDGCEPRVFTESRLRGGKHGCDEEDRPEHPSPGASESAPPGPTITPGLGTPVAVPSGLVAVPGAGAVGLQWDAVEGTLYYNIYRSDTQGVGYEGAGSSRKPSFVDADVQPGSTYYYVVTAVGPGDGQSRGSNEASATLPAPAEAPTPHR